MQKDKKRIAHGGNIWRIQNTSSYISTRTDGSISNPTSVESTSSPKTTDTTNPTSTKRSQTRMYQEEKSQMTESTPKRGGIR